MSWARYWATRASEALYARAAIPLAARSWLMRLNWAPAAPPTPTMGGLGGRRVGAGRATTGAGAAGAAGAAVGAGVGGGVTRRAIRPRPLTPDCNDPRVVPCAPVSGRVAIGCAGRLPRMPMVASTARGPPTIRTTLVTERDNTDSPLWSSLADFRGSAAERPSFQAPEKPSRRAIR